MRYCCLILKRAVHGVINDSPNRKRSTAALRTKLRAVLRFHASHCVKKGLAVRVFSSTRYELLATAAGTTREGKRDLSSRRLCRPGID
jgi:hypothetical protein